MEFLAPMISEEKLSSWLPIYNLLIRLEEFRTMGAKGVLRGTMLYIVLAMSTILTFAGARSKGASRYFFVMMFVFMAFDCVIRFITEFGTSQKYALLFREGSQVYRGLLRLSHIFNRYTSAIWCCTLPTALFVSFFITLSVVREMLFFTALATVYEVRDIMYAYPVVYQEKVRLVVVSIAIFCLLALLFICLLDLVRPVLYAFFGAFFLCYVIYAMGINRCGFNYVFEDKYILNITDWLPIMLTACVGLTLQLIYVFRTKKASSE